MLGLDLGARFLRGAICDLRGDVRARQDVELAGADAGDGARRDRGAARARSSTRPGCAPSSIDGAVVGVPGVVDAATGRLSMATNLPGLEGRATSAPSSASGSTCR